MFCKWKCSFIKLWHRFAEYAVFRNGCSPRVWNSCSYEETSARQEKFRSSQSLCSRVLFCLFYKKKKFLWKEELEKVKDKKTKRSSTYWFSPEMAAKAGLEQTEAWSLELRPAPVANRDPSTGTILHCSPRCNSRELDQSAACRTLTDSHIRYHCGQWLNSLCLRASRRALSLWAW